jgi:tellurite resistance protein
VLVTFGERQHVQTNKEERQVQNIFDSQEEARAHLAALRLIAESDNQVTTEEKSYIENLASVYQTRYPDFSAVLASDVNVDLSILLKSITTRKSKMVLLQDLLSMASIDGNFCGEEKQKLFEVAGQLSVTSQDVDKLQALNFQLLEANRQLAEFLFGIND